MDVVGHVRQAELPRELARATCLVLPSVTTRRDREPWGMVVNEAMHAGLAVLASTAVGAAAAGVVETVGTASSSPSAMPPHWPARSNA